MKIVSCEGSTGLGASRATKVLIVGLWIRVSALPNVRFLGSGAGLLWRYAAEIPAGTPVAHFYQDNGGHELVEVEGGPRFASFREAHQWGQQIGGLSEEI